jgi:16S rRNA (uracil1498-N3)-methyltransferase
MDRFFADAGSWKDGVALRGDEAHHCVRVMRKKPGDRIMVFDGEGREGVAAITAASKSEVALELLSSSDTRKPAPEIEIAVGIPKGKSFELILQKAVELGVSRIQPLMSAQGNVRFGASEGEGKREKWQRVVLEACKQCGQKHLPQVARPLGLEEYLEQLPSGGARFAGALLPGARPFRESLSGAGEPDRVVLLVGPEGDFSSTEYRMVEEAGFAGVSLGELILRTETAVFWMVSAVRYQFQQ